MNPKFQVLGQRTEEGRGDGGGTPDTASPASAAPTVFGRSIYLLLGLGSSWNAPSPQPPRPQHRAMRGAAKKAASEELERRSQYLSSLVQRTKIMGDNAAAAADHDKKEVVEATAAKPERREQLRQWSQQRMQEKEVVEESREKKKGVGDGDRCVGDVRDPPQGQQQQQQKEEEMNVKVRAADMSLALQKHAFRCARETLTSMPKLESKRLALALKKEFDSTYGPAWHCIVGTSFGSYVTHSLGGFLYFSIDKVYILLFRTAVEPVDR
ncbi:uncharacterized protein LOC103999174 [Musa acuminata AAA Group]